MRRKWAWVILFWLVQAALPYVLFIPMVHGGWPTGREWFDDATSGGYFAWVGGAIALLTIGQAVFLLPVRRPRVAARGTPLWLSLALAGLVFSGMVSGFVLAMLDVAWMVTRDPELEAGNYAWWALGLLVSGWALATTLLIRFCHPGRPDEFLSRLAARLFLGTMVEALAIIPLNVMMRRRDDCYCAHGTLWALIFCAAIGWFALGPAVVLPLIVKRRKHWYAGHCGACNYDMSGCLSAERCPECGAGWKPTSALGDSA